MKFRPVELTWADPAANSGEGGRLVVWHTAGYLVKRHVRSKGIDCLVVAQNWNPRQGWGESITIPWHLVQKLRRRR